MKRVLALAIAALAGTALMFALVYRSRTMQAGGADPIEVWLDEFMARNFHWAVPALLALLGAGVIFDAWRCLSQARVLPFALIRIFTSLIMMSFLALAWFIAH